MEKIPPPKKRSCIKHHLKIEEKMTQSSSALLKKYFQLNAFKFKRLFFKESTIDFS